MYARYIDTPPIWQWDRYANSEANRSNNCAVASCANMLNYYRDSRPPGYSQDSLRHGAGIPDGTPTGPSQQLRMLQNGGVPAYISQPSLVTVKALIRNGTRPVLAGLWFARVPPTIADHPFQGFHAITLMANEDRFYNGVLRSGIVYRDPNFSPWTNRLDPDDGRKWIPDFIFEYAFVSDLFGSKGWAVIPVSEKHVLPDTSLPEDILPKRLLVPNPPLMVQVTPAKVIRREPRFAAPPILPDSELSVGPYPLIGFTDQGEAYDIGGGKKSKKWGLYKVNTDPADKYAGYAVYFPAVYGDTTVA